MALMAYDIPGTWFGDLLAPRGEPAEAEKSVYRGAAATLDRLAEPLDGRDWSIDRRVVRGRTPNAIVEAATDLAADLIVVGSRGHGPLASMLLGSVSAEVVERATCSVLVARGSGVSRLLVATDGSPCAELVPEVLATWGAFNGLPTIALSVAEADFGHFWADGGHSWRNEPRLLGVLNLAAEKAGWGTPPEAGARAASLCTTASNSMSPKSPR